MQHEMGRLRRDLDVAGSLARLVSHATLIGHGGKHRFLRPTVRPLLRPTQLVLADTTRRTQHIDVANVVPKPHHLASLTLATARARWPWNRLELESHHTTRHDTM